jgi:beta-galactosidase GanA
MRTRPLAVVGLCFPLLAACGAPKYPGAPERPLPSIVHEDGRHALFVDGAPFLMLGAQVNNSSAWPAVLPKVWPAIEYLHANTVEMPIYWEQFEPEPRRFDTSVLDTLLAEARRHEVRLVLLWFGTWKNGSAHYLPEWAKRSPERFPCMLDEHRRPVDSPSPFAAAALEADARAFTALMAHLRDVDRERTVLMVQVENEPGTWGYVRDFSPEAERRFAAPPPAELLTALHKEPAASWRAAFGDDADEFFHAWSVASYVGRVAAAGKAVYPLPLYANAALRDPLEPGRPPKYESGGPTDNVIEIWKAAAPALELVAPDIYMGDSPRYLKVLELYDRRDNPLFVPETGRGPGFARYFFAALAHGAIGFSPFGVDYTSYVDSPLGATRVTEETLAPFALNYRLVGPMQRELARLAFAGKTRAVVEEKDKPRQTFELGRWKVNVAYGLGHFGPSKDPPGNPEPTGRVLVADLGEDRFLVAGFFCRVDFQVRDESSGKQRRFIRVEEGSYEGGLFRAARIWNGDQTDWGLNFASAPELLRVSLATF